MLFVLSMNDFVQFIILIMTRDDDDSHTHISCLDSSTELPIN